MGPLLGETLAIRRRAESCRAYASFLELEHVFKAVSCQIMVDNRTKTQPMIYHVPFVCRASDGAEVHHTCGGKRANTCDFGEIGHAQEVWTVEQHRAVSHWGISSSSRIAFGVEVEPFPVCVCI